MCHPKGDGGGDGGGEQDSRWSTAEKREIFGPKASTVPADILM